MTFATFHVATGAANLSVTRGSIVSGNSLNMSSFAPDEIKESFYMPNTA